jgi:hypothetical protein
VLNVVVILRHKGHSVHKAHKVMMDLLVHVVSQVLKGRKVLLVEVVEELLVNPDIQELKVLLVHREQKVQQEELD